MVFFFWSSPSLWVNSYAQVWQWSVRLTGVISPETNTAPQAFLWIPEHSHNVKAVVVAQHNMIEEGILENASFRQTLTELNMAAVWITPGFDFQFDFHKGADKIFETLMTSLAEVSGYDELHSVPIVPIGHSAMASFPWNFAAWNPARTLAVVSIHGDTPQTNLTGNGRPNPNWGQRTIEGVPGLFIMGEYEWWEARLQPGFNYLQKHPETPLTFLADVGHGHFDYSQSMIDYLCLYLKKVVKSRIQKDGSLKFISPTTGWLIDRWHKDSLPLFAPAPYALYQGKKNEASFCFDKEMANATERFYAQVRGKIRTYLGFKQEGTIVPLRKTHANFHLDFKPLSDGISFRLTAFFSDSSHIQPVNHFALTPLQIDRICGPVKKVNDSTFQLTFYRMGFDNLKRSNEIWLLAHNEGDKQYKSTVQQLTMKFPLKNSQGKPQSITFPTISPLKTRQKYTLNAVSDAGLPVAYYIKEGPAELIGNELILKPIPPKAKYPLKITVVAWQYGVAGKIKSATPVEQIVYIEK